MPYIAFHIVQRLSDSTDNTIEPKSSSPSMFHSMISIFASLAIAIASVVAATTLPLEKLVKRSDDFLNMEHYGQIREENLQSGDTTAW